MNKKGASLLFFLTAVFFLLEITSAQAAVPQVCDGSSCVNVEVVSKEADMERGLMYRSSLGQQSGMLFKFDFDAPHAFWMKNMHFNLDMLWIALDGHIVYIASNVPACTNDPCPIYTPSAPGRYVLELNNGFTSANHWKLGDKLDFKNSL